MTDDKRWQSADALFEKALELPTEEREAFLDACDDEELRAQVRRLLKMTEQSDDFLVPGAPLEDSLAGLGLEQDSDDGDEEATALLPDLFHSGHVVAGRYRLDKSAGVGGMGAVFRARDLKLERDVAVKFVGGPGLGSSWRERLLREARAAAALNHPNVVTIHDVGEEQGVPFLVLEFVDGPTLEQQPPADLDEVRETVLQVCDALEHVHGRGIVHRDLKPANLLAVEAKGSRMVKMADLGIALAGGDSRLTGGGKMLGTPSYMAPEQATGETIDARTDLYALGVMLYQWCTGSLPFKGDTALSVVSQHVHAKPVPPCTLRPDLPPALDRIIRRLLAKEAGQRFGSAGELRGALLEAFGEKSVPQGPAAVDDAPAAERQTVSIPKPRTRLIGRTKERETIRRLIVDENVRLVTLSGPGGCGKTRLALQIAEDLSGHFAGRVSFVPLSAISEAELVPSAIAKALGLRGLRSATDGLQRELAASAEPTLLILDNFEQVMGAAARIGELLAAAPTLSVVVTSREMLRLYAEHDVPVAPLDVPRGDTLPALDELERCSAIQLFCERARAAHSRFRLTAENAPAIVELCARLDGLPLALELAAARARMLSPQSMLARLHSRLSLLTSGARDLPDRQQTLRGALDWSYELIEGPEKALFCRLGAFVGGFTLEGAEAVSDPYGKLGLDVVEGVESLVDKSLVQREEGEGEETRFSMLETIREYAAEKLAESDGDDTRKAHAAYYLVLAEEGGGQLAGGEEARWVETFTREHDNLRAALEWLTEQREVEWGLRLAAALFHFWERGEYFSEGRRRFAALLDLPGSHLHKSLRARALHAAGVLAFNQDRNLPEGRRLQTMSLELYRELGDDRGIAVALNGLAINATERGDYDEAREQLTAILEIWERLGDDIGYARSLSNLAFVLKIQHEHAEAREMYERAVGLFERAGDRIGAAWAVNHHADVAAEQGELDDADRLYGRALEAFRKFDNRWGIATCLADMGSVAAKRGDAARATELYRQALQIFAALDHKRGMARLLETLATAAVMREEYRHGLILAAAAAALRKRIARPATDDEAAALAANIKRVRQAIGPDATDAGWDDGLELPLERAVRLALGE